MLLLLLLLLMLLAVVVVDVVVVEVPLELPHLPDVLGVRLQAEEGLKGGKRSLPQFISSWLPHSLLSIVYS